MKDDKTFKPAVVPVTPFTATGEFTVSLPVAEVRGQFTSQTPKSQNLKLNNLLNHLLCDYGIMCKDCALKMFVLLHRTKSTYI